MRRFVIAGVILALAAVAAVLVAPTPAAAFNVDQCTTAAATTCLDKHCPNNTHCCYGCTGNPICVRNGVPCPECAPQ